MSNYDDRIAKLEADLQALRTAEERRSLASLVDGETLARVAELEKRLDEAHHVFIGMATIVGRLISWAHRVGEPIISTLDLDGESRDLLDLVRESEGG